LVCGYFTASPIVTVSPDLSPDPDNNNNNDDDEDELEVCNHILYTVITLAEDIRTGSTISQRLVEAYTWNSALVGIKIPSWATDFSDVFNRESFDSLPVKHRNPSVRHLALFCDFLGSVFI
jgi:hypothetical protein